jgi:hypothetical protein
MTLTLIFFAIVIAGMIASAFVVFVSSTKKRIQHNKRVRLAILEALYEVPNLNVGALRWAVMSKGALVTSYPGGDLSFERQLGWLIFWRKVKRARDGRLVLSSKMRRAITQFERRSTGHALPQTQRELL